jgi:hypothetical protein
MSSINQAETRKSLSLEQRLEPKLREAEYLLVLVLAVMLWTAGFVDLYTHSSRDKVVFGLYSIPYFLVLFAYFLGFVFWSWLIFPANSIDRFKRGLSAIQRTPGRAMAFFLLPGLLLTSMFLSDRWLRFPLLEASMVLLILLAGLVVLISRPDGSPRLPGWRRRTLLGLGLLVAAEIGLQALALLHVFPARNVSGLFTPYGRVYQNREGFTNTRTNRYGWHYPDFPQTPGSRRVVMTGDTYVLALEVQPEQHLGVLLGNRMQQSSSPDNTSEILALGLPGYGPGLYLDVPLFRYTIEPLEPSEVIVFFHLANDFQTAIEPSGQIPFFTLDENRKVAIHPQDFRLRHDLQHVVLRGFDPPNPVRTAGTHLFLFDLAESFLRDRFQKPQFVPVPTLNTERIDATHPLGASSFIFRVNPGTEARDAFEIAIAQLETYHHYLRSLGVRMRLVTIPYFPPHFYSRYEGKHWDSRLGEYDLFLPERILGEFASRQGVDFLPFGQYLKERAVTTEQLKALFFGSGTGHFTARGHAVAADALYASFYHSEGVSLTRR